MDPIYFSPDNNLALIVTLRDVDEATGRLVPLLTGAVETYLATDEEGELVADASLVGTVVHIARGLWLVKYSGAAFDRTLLEALFSASGANETPYLIVKLPSNIKAFVPLTYRSARPMEIRR